jgi:hypothetical protein
MTFNIIIKNRYFKKPVNDFFNMLFKSDKEKFQNSKNIYCDIDSLYQYQNYEKCHIINQLKDYNIFGDKYTHYKLLTNNKKKSKYLLNTYLFNINNLNKIKKILKNYPIWIIKPRNNYGRKGVTIIRNYNDIYNWIKQDSNNKEWILQKYVDNPILINKKKVHLRIYVILKKNKNKFNVYVYNKGFIYSSEKNYNNNSNDLNIHLSGEDNKNRVTIFDKNHYLFYKIWKKIILLVKDCIIPIQPYVKCPNQNNYCYKFLGLDILIDNNFNIYLAEINSRLISLKYPPPNFKNELYSDILNTIYFNKPKNLQLVYTNQIENFSKKNNKNLINYFFLFIIILLTSSILIYIKIYYK